LKRINRESFALKLAIYNKNEGALKFLIDGEPGEIESAEDDPVSD